MLKIKRGDKIKVRCISSSEYNYFTKGRVYYATIKDISDMQIKAHSRDDDGHAVTITIDLKKPDDIWNLVFRLQLEPVVRDAQ